MGLGLDVEQHLRRDVIQKDHEKPFKKPRGKPGSQEGPGESANEDAGSDGFDDGPVYRAAPLVGHGTGNGGEDDGSQRRPKRHLHDDFVGKTLGGEKEVQGRHDDNAAADAKQAGDDAGGGPKDEITQQKRQ